MSANCFVNAYLDGSKIVAFSRQAGGGVVARNFPAEYSTFIEGPEVEITKLRKSSCVKKLITEKDGKFRVCWNNYWVRRDFEEKVISRMPGFKSYEGHVSPMIRWLVDHKIEIQRPLRCYLDIETDSRVSFFEKEKMRILCWVVMSEDGSKVDSGVLHGDNDIAEKQLLQSLWSVLSQYDQVVAWNGDRFDFPVIQARSLDRGIEVNFQRWLWLDHLEIYKKYDMHSASSGDEKQSFTLGAVATAKLGHGKTEGFDGSMSWSAWEAGGEMREKLVEYCVNDTNLLLQLEQKTGYLELLFTICEVCHVFPSTSGANPTQQVESYLLRLGVEIGHRFVTKFPSQSDQTFSGGFILEPQQLGILKDVRVCDFASLYPSIIITWNISPETYRPNLVAKNGEMPSGVCQTPDGKFFDTTKKGILPLAIEGLLKLRSEWNDKKSKLAPGAEEWQQANRRTEAYKQIANGFFGVVGSKFSPFFDPAMIEAVPSSGVYLIKLVLKEMEKIGISVVYAATDSGFSVGCSESQFADFVEYINTEAIPLALQKFNCIENRVKLVYEKDFDVLVMVGKNRYAARFARYKGVSAGVNSAPEIKGLEYKRGDSTRMSRKFQAHALDLLLGGGIRRKRVSYCDSDLQTFVELVKIWRYFVLHGDLNADDVKLSKTLTKPLKEYVTKTKKNGAAQAEPHHVFVAKLLAKRGKDVAQGTKIHYIVLKQGCPIPADDWDGSCDRAYLWDHYVYPAVQRVLEVCFQKYDWEQFESHHDGRQLELF